MENESVEITIRNYRSIPYNNPITISIKPGITFILGVNNVGKSNLLRFFYELRWLFSGKDFNGENITYEKIKNQQSIESIKIDFKYYSNILKCTIAPTYGLSSKEFGKSFNLDGIDNINPFNYFIHKPMSEIFDKSMYVGSFRVATVNASSYYFDISIGRYFVNQWHSWANGNDIGTKKKIRELKEEIKDIFGFKKFEIAVKNDNQTLEIENENGFFDLEELGAGISHYILVLLNALIKEPNFILIDEPENGLHPKMQIQFITALAKKAKYGIIATSHSIGLARSVADTTYYLSKKENGRLSLDLFGEKYSPSVFSSINEMGYSQFVELGGNHILLVEGRTDIKAFREILRKYNIEQYFIIIDLGGRTNINGKSAESLAELTRLNAKSYNVIFDSEYEAENQDLKADFQAFVSNCQNLGFNVFPTDYHSTENYITQEALDKKYQPNQYQALNKYEKRDKIRDFWDKNDNWLLIKEMNLEDFENTGLDKFIREVLMKNL
jgi:ABC-type cobalamin/Fe3+-siderophores transport system ATPase subunit